MHPSLPGDLNDDRWRVAPEIPECPQRAQEDAILAVHHRCGLLDRFCCGHPRRLPAAGVAERTRGVSASAAASVAEPVVQCSTALSAIAASRLSLLMDAVMQGEELCSVPEGRPHS